ncbi:MAG: beta-galactosidase [Lachnospiraceae bacterium]|nr:beta-galactosidase [Butyrivibrio sp.]MCM1342575.1 beta-galactosidase [Muribaculaceae bacterium]MCM1411949.1 beta-galactosidase [Lachnospiraceae bacterium]
MTEYTYNSDYLMRDGKAWFPVMGEMHFTRYREELWEESLRKMKAGGVTIVSTYIIWIHHEEEEGIFDFSGCRNVRKFVELCRKVGLLVCLRLGPWVHGEARNGGFPDWVVEKGENGVGLRSNDEAYMALVRHYWTQVYEQVRGLMLKDGGPVIAMQLENEYGHVGGFRGEKGEAHMRALMALAKEIGLEVPIYTATGWGGAVIGDCIPVMGGYCEAPWDQSVEELSANTNYVISHVRNDALIACDHHVEDAITFDESRFPYLTAELGGGMQATSHRRPVATGTDIGAMSVTKLASGVALLGYYMYHGGSNPIGKLSTMQESRDTGSPNDLPEINYDFNAPIRQYGTISDTYREVKLLASFLRDFGEDMAPLKAEIFPDDVKPEDMHTLRTSCRHDDTHGYVFFNNYQRRRTMDSHKDVVFKGFTAADSVTFPAVDIESGTYGFFPYHMRLGGAVLVSALATPFCSLNGEEGTYVFYGDYEPSYLWKDDRAADVLHLTREQALNAWKVTLDRDYLVLSENYVWEENGELVVAGGADTRICVYPEPAKAPAGFEKRGEDGRFCVYERKISHGAALTAKAEVRELFRTDDRAVYEISISYPEKEDRMTGRDTLLWLEYAGYGMEIRLDGKKINDHYYTGQKVPVSLGYFDFPEKLEIVVNVLKKDDRVFIEKWPELKDGKACSLNRVQVTEEYR